MTECIGRQPLRVGVLATHPIQYYVPWYRALAQQLDLTVFYCHQQSPQDQAAAGFDVAFAWDVPLLDGYQYRFLTNIARRPNVSSFAGCDTPEIMGIVRAAGFDAFIVHGWATKSFWQATVAAWWSGVPILVRGDSHLLTPRSPLWRTGKYPLYRALLPRFTGHLVVGERSRQYLRHYGVPERKLFFVPHTVDNAFFSRRAVIARSIREELRRSWGLPSDSVVYLFAGKCIARKHLEDFVRAVAIASRAQPRIWGLVVGDGALRAPLEAQVRQQEWPLRFIGFLNQTEIPNAYGISDALVLPSDATETWGLVVNEAMASGLPAFVSDCVGCAPDLVRPGVTGDVFPCGDVERLAALLVTHAASDQHLRRLGQQAYQHIQSYSMVQATERTSAAVAQVCNRRDVLLQTMLRDPFIEGEDRA